MDDKFKNRYRTTSFRRPGWDYGSHALYFVTICTHSRINYFGNLDTVDETAVLQMTDVAKVAVQNWLAIPQFFPFVEVDEFVLMPNHLHGILFLNKPDKQTWELNTFGPQSQNLASIIRGYKASVKKYATQNQIEFSWQAKYHDRIIRDQEEYFRIKDYIVNNLNHWAADAEYVI